MWIILAIVSALLLGVYDIFKKESVNENAVIPVLFFATSAGALVFLPIILVSAIFPEFASQYSWFAKPVSLQVHLLILLKSFIVSSQWVFAYFAVKNLPVTIASPIRASAPRWTLFGAVLIFGERMNTWQWLGLGTTIFFYYLFSLAGNKEGINFRNNKWVLYMTVATVIGSISSLFDKYLIAHFPRITIQSYYSLYMVLLLIPVLLLYWYPRRKLTTSFKWKNTIPMIGITLAVADFAYFYALSYTGSLIAIVSMLRRGSVLVTFGIGAYRFKEQNIKNKAWALAGILLGLAIIIVGSM